MTFKSDIVIVTKKEKLYMISYGKKSLTGTKIISKSLSETQQKFFNFLWRNS
jgi:hypothetical protein